MSREIPPRVVAEMDQFFAEADEKYEELIDLLRKIIAEESLYEGIAFMVKTLDSAATRQTLLSMVATGMRREILRGDAENRG